MDVSTSAFSLLAALVLFTSFVKVTTALSILRYGLGLVGMEFGVATLVAAFGLSVLAAPAELKQIGVPAAFFRAGQHVSAEAVAKALTPYMIKQIDTRVAVVLGVPTNERGELVQDAAVVAPAFLVSELQAALKIGVTLLVPFVALDLIVAHLITIVGVRQLATSVVSLPCKLLLFLSVDGWALITKKLLGI
jgi:flagellar biosynthetic protein FliP